MYTALMIGLIIDNGRSCPGQRLFVVYQITNCRLAEVALRFAVASILFDFDLETSGESDAGAIMDLEKEINMPWRLILTVKLSPRLQEHDDDPDIQGYSIIDI